MAIAYSVLQHLIEEIKCKSLFITHYPFIGTSMVQKFPSKVSNVHMAFTEEQGVDGLSVIQFLYQVRDGLATGSFGVECGRLAGLPEPLLIAAAERASQMRETVEAKAAKNRWANL